MNNERARLSFTSADTLPMKLIRMPEAGTKLRPIHIQWLPTNRCNLNCKFCSCSGRQKHQEMDIELALKIIDDFTVLGTKAVTITGGGEPLMHSSLSTMVSHFRNRGVDVGLVTNGLLLDTMTPKVLDLLTWCRISHSDCRDTSDRYFSKLSRVIHLSQKVDWAFSYVVSDSPNYINIKRIVEFANARFGVTHVRLVGDLLCPDKTPMNMVQESLRGVDRKVIYQPRKHYEAETSCLLGYVKPLVAPDFSMYLCCGVQYALKEMSLDLPSQLMMGDARYLKVVYDNISSFQVPCKRCYYRSYNEVLHAMQTDIEHENFI